MATENFIKSVVRYRHQVPVDFITEGLGLAMDDKGDGRTPIFTQQDAPLALEKISAAALLLSSVYGESLDGKGEDNDSFSMRMSTALFDLFERLLELLPPETAARQKVALLDVYVAERQCEREAA